MSYSPRGETADLNGAVFDLAADRLVRRALEKVGQRYQALFDGEHGATIARARASAKEYRQLAREFGCKVDFYQRKLERGDAEGVDYRAEIRDALLDAQLYDSMAEAEEQKAAVSKVEQDELWKKAMNGVAGDIGNRTLEKVEAEETAVYQDLLSQISRNLDEAAIRIAIESHRPYLDASRASIQEALRRSFGVVYVGEPEVTHVDGRLDHRTLATIYTDAPELTMKALMPQLELSEGSVNLVSSGIIHLRDGSGTSIVEARYAGSKKLHD